MCARALILLCVSVIFFSLCYSALFHTNYVNFWFIVCFYARQFCVSGCFFIIIYCTQSVHDFFCRAHFNSLVACNSSLLYSLLPSLSTSMLCRRRLFSSSIGFLFMCVLIAQSYFWCIWQLPNCLSLLLQKAFMNFYYPYNPNERGTHTHTHT